jgi:hypothetical protein
MPDSYWCGQDCFKASWNAHKVFHANYVEGPAGVFSDRRFNGCNYTGKLRKGFEGPPRLVPAEIKRPVYVNTLRGTDPRETDAKREKVTITMFFFFLFSETTTKTDDCLQHSERD